VTEATYELLEEQYVLEERGPVFVKGKGEMTTCWFLGKK
jgi:adenylate cyclase